MTVNVGEFVEFGNGAYWVIIAVNSDRVYIRPSRFDDHIPDQPHYRVGEILENGKPKLTLLPCQTPADEPHAQPARKRARKRPCSEQLSLFDSGVGEGS